MLLQRTWLFHDLSYHYKVRYFAKTTHKIHSSLDLQKDGRLKKIRNRKHVSRSMELKQHEWKFGRMRNDKPTGECFHKFFDFSQTSMSVSITHWKHREHVFHSFSKIVRKRRKLVCINHQIVNSLSSHHHHINISCKICVSIELQKPNLIPISTYFHWVFDTISSYDLLYHTILRVSSSRNGKTNQSV